MPKYAEEILAAVTELQRHPTAEQVFMEMKKEHPSIAIGTVYKHLNALAEEGLLHLSLIHISPFLPTEESVILCTVAVDLRNSFLHLRFR